MKTEGSSGKDNRGWRERRFRRRLGIGRSALAWRIDYGPTLGQQDGEGEASAVDAREYLPEPAPASLDNGGSGDQGVHDKRVAEDQHDPDHYISPDTAPQGYAVTRPLWLAPAFLALFVAGCAALVPALPTLTDSYASVLATLTREHEQDLLGQTPSLYFRPFLALLILLLNLFALGPRRRKLRLLVLSLCLYATALLALDVALAASGGALPSPFSSGGGIVAAILGLLVILVTIFAGYNLPAGVKVVRRGPRSRRTIALLALCAALAFAFVAVLLQVRDQYLDGFEIRFIGGLNSGVVLFLLALWIALFVVSVRSGRRKPRSGPQLSVAFLVPAYNEGHEIARTIEAIDTAASNYGGRSVLYVVDNGSTDGTPQRAARALLWCRSLEGEVLECPPPGKGRALNFGLSRGSEDIVIRIDADTLVPADLLEKTIPWFWDPTVGGVGGLPMPRADTPRWLYPFRIIELIYGVAFLRVAQAGADATMVMPGMFASYRRAHLDELGGFGEGFNGEDADVTMRLGRLGYRIVTDASIHVHTEVPKTLMHLREQRQRWARGLFHMASRNLSAIWLRQGARGLWLLPWSLLNGLRRSLMIPLLACALTVELLDPSVLSLREVSVIAGFIVGLQMIVIVVLLLAHRRFAVIPFVPAYLLFRMFRSYVAFETILTLPLKKSAGRSSASAFGRAAEGVAKGR
jgi:cellulose synthase/poly-beta-1,6-N-acetylglucosamine synthase-like glycosyltransferase